MSFTQKYFTADTHFGHKLMTDPKLRRPRPFSSTQEMDEFLIRAWNTVVRPDDLIYHLGDFAFGLHDQARVKSVFNRLQGRKILILGNHDYGGGNAVAEAIAELPWEQVTQQLWVDVDDGQKVSARTTRSGRGPASAAVTGIFSDIRTARWLRLAAAGMSASIAPMSATHREHSSS